MTTKCPAGTILRKGYTRKSYTRSDGTFVKGSKVPPKCVKDTGLKGKTPSSKKVLPKPVKGNLGKYGYFNIKSTNASLRRQALTKGVKKEGYATIIRRVNLIANYNKNTDPKAHAIMKSDIKWIQNNLYNYSKAAAKKTSKK
jgi:hypothetical protein